MTKCKDCAHVDICEHYANTLNQRLIHYCEIQIPSEKAVIHPEPCEYFKDRSRSADLPCKVGDYLFLNKSVNRKNYIYARVSSYGQKKELQNQVDLLTNYCFQNGIKIDRTFSDIASGISFEKRKHFFELLDDVVDGKVATVVITYKDRLSRAGFELFYHLFQHYGAEIIVISEQGSTKLDSQEIFEEIVSLLHCYSMKLYSKRHLDKIKEVIKDDARSD